MEFPFNIQKYYVERHDIDPSQINGNRDYIECIERYKFASHYARGGYRILDIGCGNGYGCSVLVREAPHVKEVVGVDLDDTTLDQARKKYAGNEIKFLQTAASKLPFPDHYFDLIVAFELIEHVEDPEAVMGEIKRVLHPAGTLIISTPNRDVCKFQIRYLVYWALFRKPPNPFHVTEFNTKELLGLLSARFNGITLFGQHFIRASVLNYPTLFILTLLEKLLRFRVKDKFYNADHEKRNDVRPFIEKRGVFPNTWVCVCKDTSREDSSSSNI